MKAGSTETESPVEACWLSKTQEGQTEQIHPQAFDDPFFLTALSWSICTGFPLERQSTRNTIWGFKGVKEEIRRKRLALFKSSQWHFHQDNATVHNFILITDYLTKMGIKTVPQPPSSPDLAPCDFLLFFKLRGCRRYERIKEMKVLIS